MIEIINNEKFLNMVDFNHLMLFQTYVKMSSEESAVFAGYRPLGYVSNHIPCITRLCTVICWVFLIVRFSQSDFVG